MMQIFINDSPVTCSENNSLLEILSANAIPLVNIAVAIDSTVIPKARWGTTQVSEGSQIMVIKAVQGG